MSKEQEIANLQGQVNEKVTLNSKINVHIAIIHKELDQVKNKLIGKTSVIGPKHLLWDQLAR